MKYQSGIHYGPVHFHDMVLLIDHHCNDDEIAVCRVSLQENSYMMNPENILLAMLGTYT